MEHGKTIDQLNIGDRASISQQIAERDVIRFAELTGDINPIHMDKFYAEQTIFGERIAHGMLIASLISAVLGMKLPGPGNIYISQSLKFRAPVKFGDVIEAEVEVIEKIPERNRVRLRTTCRNQDDTVVLEGEAVVIPRSE
ncbi:MAG: MaoC family dehydratase [Dehalococcoidia bacterium]|jgi:3-hydroxybutyryl-CoA dehydratase|nr:MAG: MaoC family dehydratase [Dehalococcoidia bacterium]TET45739.1 MAG: MaoC family dehydratase [Dehalococcoidia bacterium]